MSVKSDWPHHQRKRFSLGGFLWQGALIVAVLLVIGGAAWNAANGLARQGIASGFGFLNNTAGFDISQHLIDYSAVSTYGQAFLVGLLNTLVVSVIAIPLATILGFIIGIMRRSDNWLLSRVAAGYVELFRNTPLLLQLLFWYNAVLVSLPSKVSESLHIGDVVYLNRRGLSLPQPVLGTQIAAPLVALGISVVLALLLRAWAIRRHRETGLDFPAFLIGAAIVCGLPLIASLLTQQMTGVTAVSFDLPQPGRFGVTGGWQMLPEFVALLLGLIIYTAASIAEVVRSGLSAVSKGQFEASHALHLSPVLVLRLVVVPQAIRIIIPPLTNQYLNLVKNSSLAVAIGYPDLVQVFAGTVLNQTGQAVEVVLMTMGVYLTISLITSAAMNYYNEHVKLVER
jgi:general L-amino acid transport system permease protein